MSSSRQRQFLVLALAALALAACTDETHPVACHGPDLGLDGTWFGAMEDDDGTLFTMEWQVCGSRITREVISGVDFGISGQLWPDGAGAWRGRLSDGTEVRMLTDPLRRHATVITEYFEFAVLQRHARALPRYRAADLDGHWRGRHAWIRSSATYTDTAWALCGAGRCDSYEAGGVAATLVLRELERDFGLFRGSFTDSLGDRGIAGALMSADLQFLGTYTCPTGYRGVADCTFGALLFDD